MMKEEDYGSFYTKDEGEQGQPQVPGKEDCLPTYKVVILGDSEVGKSAIMVRYTDDVFNSSQMSTIGADLRIKKVKVGDEEVTLQLWDTAGQERFRSITSSYFKEMDGIIMVYSVTARNTYQNIRSWMFSIEESSPNFRNTCAVAIVGNKIDLASERCVSQEDGKSLAKLYGTPFYEVSAKTGENISTVFSDLAAALHKKNKKSAEHNNGNVSLSETKKNKFKQKCCGK